MSQCNYTKNAIGNNSNNDLVINQHNDNMLSKFTINNHQMVSSLPQPIIKNICYNQLPKSSSPINTINGFIEQPLEQQKINNGYNNTNINNINKDEIDIVTEMNKLYKKSPFVQRKQVEINKGSAVYGDSPKRESILSSIVRNITTSPFSQRKIQNQPEGYWNLSNPPDGGGGIVAGTTGHYNNGFNHHQLQQNYLGDDMYIREKSTSASPSPIGGRKRFQTTVPILNDNTPQYSRLQGNTSPIVLQRFYHQQNQLREREREKHQQHNQKIQIQKELNSSSISNSNSGATTNPFLNSFIPKYHPSHQISSQIPIQQQQSTSQINPSESPMLHDHYTKNLPHQQQQVLSSSPNNYQTSHIPVYTQQQELQSQSNSIQQFDGNFIGGNHSGEGYIYNKNLYGRTQAMQGVQQQAIGKDVSSHYKDEGAVKRQFASYVKLHLTHGDKQHQDNNKEQNNSTNNRNSRSIINTNGTNINSSNINGISSSQITNDLDERYRQQLQQQHQLSTSSSGIQPPNPHVLSGTSTSAMSRHRSPDPPPRYNRGQSPLLLRKNLLELSGQVPSGSPLMQRRYITGSPPLPPPRRGSESVPGSPQHLRTRIHYTPEPQRRIYRTIDQ